MKKVFLLSGIILVLVIISMIGMIWFLHTPQNEETQTSTRLSVIDTHAHLYWNSQDEDGYLQAYEEAQRTTRERGTAFTIVAPPPFAATMRKFYDYQTLEKVVEDGFAFCGGGGSLNVMAHATDPERVTEDIKDRFENQAQAIVQNGAVGFGELSVLHLSLGEKHVYSQTPADHPLFLLLADIAAQEGMPMDIHMEAVVEDQPTPSAILEASDANPAALEENITAFERLLDYQPKANIIWAHAGWDHTGDRTIELMGRLLDDHPNLFMSLKISEDSLEASWPLDADGIFKEEWKTFLTLYADRFVIGSDQFFGTVQAQDHWGGIEKLLEQLPEDVAQKIAYENAMRLFLLDESVVE